MRSCLPLSASLSLLCACGPVGSEGFFVQLYGRVLDEEDAAAAGFAVSLAADDGSFIATASTDSDGWYSAPLLMDEWTGHQLRVRVEGDDYAASVAWFDLNLDAGESQLLQAHPPQTWSSWSRQLPHLRVSQDRSAGQAQGALVDAQTGGPPAELQGDVLTPVALDVELRLGWNAPNSEPVVAAVTSVLGDDAGEFSFEGVAPGLYTARVVAASGYTSSRFPLLLRTGSDGFTRATVTRPLATEELRVSLSWQELPADLNLHLTGPRASVTTGESEWERFHVWSDAPYHPGNASDEHDRVVQMDALADEGEGPETASVVELRAEGPYRFSVYDRSNAASSTSDALSWSGALVQVWVGTRDPLFFEITPGLRGNTWIAGAWDNGSEQLYRFQDIDWNEDEVQADSF